jgi:small subunit ribosomal protein S5
MPEILDESTNLESHTVGIYRTSATVKGGRRFSFGALVVVGDRRGKIGYGYAKSPEVPTAIEKAQKQAKRSMTTIPMSGTTLPHEVEGRFCSSKVRLLPASPGTGVVAGGTVRAVLEMAGITDCLSKCYGSTGKLNTVKAMFDGFQQIRTREQIADLRGVEIATTDIEQRIERGKRFMPARTEGEKMKAPVNTIGQDRRGGRGGGGRGGPRGGGGGGGGGRDGGHRGNAPQSSAPQSEAPASEAQS